jgi:hypothetical protein
VLWREADSDERLSGAIQHPGSFEREAADDKDGVIWVGPKRRFVLEQGKQPKRAGWTVLDSRVEYPGALGVVGLQEHVEVAAEGTFGWYEVPPTQETSVSVVSGEDFSSASGAEG